MDREACFIVTGTKDFKTETNKELEVTPLMFGEFPANREKSDKYLGQILHEDGLEASVEATIKERTGKIKGAIFLTKTIIETFQMQGIGALMAAKTLWEGAIVLSVLVGAGTWVGSSVATDLLCQELQLLFWRTQFQVPKGTPKVMLRADTNSLKMKQRIWLSKLMLARRILSQDNSLAKDIFKEQVSMGWPGLATEVKDIYQKIGVRVRRRWLKIN